MRKTLGGWCVFFFWSSAPLACDHDVRPLKGRFFQGFGHATLDVRPLSFFIHPTKAHFTSATPRATTHSHVRPLHGFTCDYVLAPQFLQKQVWSLTCSQAWQTLVDDFLCDCCWCFFFCSLISSCSIFLHPQRSFLDYRLLKGNSVHFDHRLRGLDERANLRARAYTTWS